MDPINTKPDATKVSIEVLSNYLRMVVLPQNDLLELAMREYELSLSVHILARAA